MGEQGGLGLADGSFRMMFWITKKLKKLKRSSVAGGEGGREERTSIGEYLFLEGGQSKISFM